MENISDLGCEELFQRLMTETESLRNAAVSLKKNQIDGPTLLGFSESDMEKLGLPFGPKKALQNYVKKLKNPEIKAIESSASNQNAMLAMIQLQHGKAMQLLEKQNDFFDKYVQRQEKIIESVIKSNEKSQELMSEAIKTLSVIAEYIQTPNKSTDSDVTLVPTTLFVNPMSADLWITFTHSTSGKKFNSTSEFQIDFAGKENGEYTAAVKSILGTSPLELPPFTMIKTKDMITPSFIDLKVTLVEANFFREDKPFSNAKISGLFIPPDGSKSVQISKETSAQGNVSFCVPEGTVSLVAEKVIDGTVQTLNQDISVPPPKPVTTVEQMKTIKAIVSTVNQASNLILNGIKCTGSVAVLGDCTGSMSSNNNIEKLRRTYSGLWETTKKDGLKSKIAFIAWDDKCYFCKKSWLDVSDDQQVNSWISQLQPRNHNNMKSAITDAINVFTSVENIIIICDGDVRPFNLDSWKEFRSLYSKTTFHFAALGAHSDFKTMKEMAVIGNGSYTATNIVA